MLAGGSPAAGYFSCLAKKSNQKKGHSGLGVAQRGAGTFRSLSAVGVLKRLREDGVALECYHNPFAHVPIAPSVIAGLADIQYIHPNPHDRGFIHWEPNKIEPV
jgi:hypothetical protein